MAISIATPPSPLADDDSQHTQTSPSSLLNFRQAISLARKMRHDLRPHTKDRKWGFKSYSSCFKAAHAVSWALENINTEESIAVNRLNQLVDYGLIVHVVDPSKKFRVGEIRTCYFRLANDNILDSPVRGTHLIAGTFGSGIGGDEFDSIQQQLKNVDHILRQTVQELDDTRGQFEVLHQEVLGLISQQVVTFVMIFLMFIHIIFLSMPSAGMSWFSALGLAVTLIISTRYGWRCILLWNDIDGRTIPMEALVTYDESSSAEGSIVRNAKSFHRTPNTLRLLGRLRGGGEAREYLLPQADGAGKVGSYAVLRLWPCSKTTSTLGAEGFSHRAFGRRQ